MDFGNDASYLRHCVTHDRLLSVYGGDSEFGLSRCALLDCIRVHPGRKFRFLNVYASPGDLKLQHEAPSLVYEHFYNISERVTRIMPCHARDPFNALLLIDDWIIYRLKDKNLDGGAGKASVFLCFGVGMWDVDENPTDEVLKLCDDGRDPHCYPKHLKERPWS